MERLRQGTAASPKWGPFIALVDGSNKTDLVIQKADVRLSKNGGTKASASANQGVADAGAPHDSQGDYNGSLDATDTNTLGKLKVTISKSGAVVWWKTYEVIPANVYDAEIAGTDKREVDVQEWLGAAPSAPTVAGIPKIELPAIPNNWITASGVQSGAFTAAKFASDFFVAVATGVWNALTSGMTTVGSLGKKLADWVVGTIDTYTGNTKQTGDNYPVVSSVVHGNAALKVILDDKPSKAEVQSYINALNNLSQAQVRSALGLTSANLTALLEDIPTNSEMAALVAAADDAMLAAIASLANLTQSQVQTAVGAALTAYGAATAGNVSSAVSALALEATSQSILTKANAIDGKTTNLPSDPADQSLIIAATDAIVAAVMTRMATFTYLAPDNASVLAVKLVTDKLNSMIQAAGGGQWQFDEIAMALAAGGSGGGSLTPEQEGWLQTIVAKVALLGTQGVTVTGPHSEKGKTEIIRGMEYTLATGMAPKYTSTKWPVLTDAVISLVTMDDPGTIIASGSVIVAGNESQTVAIELPATMNETLAKGGLDTIVQAVIDGQTKPIPLVIDRMNILA